MEPDTRLDEKLFAPDSLFDRLWRAFVIRPVFWWQEMKCARAKAYLLTHDRWFRSAYISNEVVLRRNELYDRGVSPSSPVIPDLWTIEAELPPMSWPNTDRFN